MYHAPTEKGDRFDSARLDVGTMSNYGIEIKPSSALIFNCLIHARQPILHLESFSLIEDRRLGTGTL